MELLFVREVGNCLLLNSVDLKDGFVICLADLQKGPLPSVEDDADEPVKGAQKHTGAVADNHGDEPAGVFGCLVRPECLRPGDGTTTVA